MGHLAPVTGKERLWAFFIICFSLVLVHCFLFCHISGYMTLSASHTVQFLKAIEVGMPSPDGHQADLPKSNPCWSCIQEGWRWVVIHSDMEESMPTLASWIQMGCNSSNSIGRPQSELELATTISKFFEGGLDLQQAIQRAKQGDIKCHGSLLSSATSSMRFAIRSFDHI